MQPSGIRAFFDLVLGMKDVISLGVGEPDFVTSWNIREAGIYSLEQGFTSYTSNKGLYKLRLGISRTGGRGGLSAAGFAGMAAATLLFTDFYPLRNLRAASVAPPITNKTVLTGSGTAVAPAVTLR